MELKQGYKQSEFGFIPDEWDVSTISDCIESNGLIRGPFGGALKKEFFVPSGYKVYEQKNAIYKSVELGQYYIDKEKFVELSRFQIKANDFIVSCSGTIGRIYLIPKQYKEGVINQALLIIRINSSKCSRAYFEHCFSSDWFQTKITDSTQGGAMKNMVGMAEFKISTIPLPPLSEQTAIANALSDMDDLISQTEKLIEKKKAIKQGAMQELLKPKEGWVTKKFTDVVNYIHGKAHEQFIVENGKYQVVNSKFVSTEGTVKKYADVSFLTAKKGDVLTVLSDLPNGKALAKCFYVEEDNKYAVNQRICIWRSTSDYPKFLFYFLNRHKYFMAINDGVSQTHILNGHIEKFFIEIPENYSEQESIAETLWDIDKELKLIETKLTKLKRQKQGMMQVLLTGKIRLVS